MADLPGWPWWKVISLTGQAGSGTDYQVKLTIGDSAGGDFHLEGNCDVFPQDIRITDNDGTTLLDHWIEDLTADPIVVHIKVNDNLDSNQDIRVYYGKSGESTASNIGNTFLIGDEFTGASIDTGIWNTLTQGTATVSQTGGEVVLALPTSQNNHAILQSINTYGIGHRLKARFKARRGIYRMYSSLGFNCNFPTRQPNDLVGETDVTGAAGNRYVYGIAKDNGVSDSGNTVTYNPDDDTYYEFEILRYADGSKIYWNDTLIHTASTQVPIDSMPIEIGAGTSAVGNAASATNSYIDWALVGKYVSPEPAFGSAGAEQSAAGAPTGVFYGPLAGPFGGPI